MMYLNQWYMYLVFDHLIAGYLGDRTFDSDWTGFRT